MKGVDPTEWANRRKAAVERAKQLREERKNAISDGDTFAPQLIARAPSVGRHTVAAPAPDALDHMLRDRHAPDVPAAQDVNASAGARRALPAPPSPNSDSLGREMKRHGAGGGKTTAGGAAAYSSSFLRQYEERETHEEHVFQQQLRGAGGRSRDVGPGWNDDTSSAGDFAAQKPSLALRRRASGASRASALDSGASELPPRRASRDALRESAPDGGDAAAWKTKASPRAAEYTPRTVQQLATQARPNLALLKSKIRQSESAGPSRSAAPPAPSFAATGRGASQQRIAREESDDVQSVASLVSQRSGGSGPPSYARRGDVGDRRGPSGARPVADQREAAMAMAARAAPLPPERSLPATGEDDADYDEEAFEEPDSDLPQHQCPDCGRKFNPIPYAKHVKICAKVFQRKRKVFDSAKMRVQDNPELLKMHMAAKRKEQQLKKAGGAASAAAAQTKAAAVTMDERPVAGGGDSAASKWKSQSEAFRAAMRAAKAATKAIAAGEPLPPPVPSAPDPSLVPCPHCGRRFNAQAAERHIPQCQNIKAKPTVLRRGGGTGGGIAGTAAQKPKKPR